MAKTHTLKDLEKRLDRVFSEYIRLANSDDLGYCQCITCGKIYYWKDIHNGHFISRAVKAARYDEMNCNPQCVSCNSFKQGQHHIYREKLIELHGKEAVEALELKAKLGGGYDSFQLVELINIYKEEVKKLKKKKGL